MILASGGQAIREDEEDHDNDASSDEEHKIRYLQIRTNTRRGGDFVKPTLEQLGLLVEDKQ